MGVRVVLALVATVGCGRVGFDVTTSSDGRGPGQTDDDGGGGNGNDDGAANTTVWQFGERAGVGGAGFDTSVDVSQSNANFGASVSMSIFLASPRLSLLGFDISSLPANRTVIAATVELVGTSTNVGTAAVYEMLEPWTEGTRNGSNGEASYDLRMTGVAWTNPGIGAPTSRSPTTMDTFTMNGGVGLVYSFSIPPDVIARWSAGTNYGVLIALAASNGGGSGFNTREATDPTKRPLLTVITSP